MTLRDSRGRHIAAAQPVACQRVGAVLHADGHVAEEQVDNLTDAALAVFGSGAVTVAALVAGKPALAPRITAALEESGPTLQTTEHVLADYLAAEQNLDRIKKDLDIKVLAFTLVGSVHHLFFTGHGTKLDSDRVRQIVATLLRR
jgi:hypothetical protein